MDNTNHRLAWLSEVEGLKSSVSEGKSLIAKAVTDKGVQTSADATFQTMANNIGQISSGGSFGGLAEVTAIADIKAGDTVLLDCLNQKYRSTACNEDVTQLLDCGMICGSGWSSERTVDCIYIDSSGNPQKWSYTESRNLNPYMGNSVYSNNCFKYSYMYDRYNSRIEYCRVDRSSAKIITGLAESDMVGTPTPKRETGRHWVSLVLSDSKARDDKGANYNIFACGDADRTKPATLLCFGTSSKTEGTVYVYNISADAFLVESSAGDRLVVQYPVGSWQYFGLFVENTNGGFAPAWAYTTSGYPNINQSSKQLINTTFIPYIAIAKSSASAGKKLTVETVGPYSPNLI